MSFMSVDGTRSQAKHAGVSPAATVAFKYGVGPNGAAVVVAASGVSSSDGRTIKLLSYTVSPSGTGSVDFGSSGSVFGVEGTSLTGNLTMASDGNSPFTQTGHPITGIGSCAVGENLVVSGATKGGDGTVTYSIVP